MSSASPGKPFPVWLLGIPLSAVTAGECEGAVLDWARSSDGECRFVATSNVDFLVKALAWGPGTTRHPELVEVLRQAAMNTADGMPLVWAARWLGGPLPARVSGSDLVPALSRSAAREGLPLFLLGGAEPVTRRAAEILRTESPALQIAGVDCPFVFTEGGKIAFEAERDREICEKINASGARILLIGFGNPKQEMWFQRNSYRLKPGVALGVGGTFNFVAGEVGRAPAWMQKAGLEWVYRFLAEPGRLWKRYAVGLVKYAVMTAPVVAGHVLLRAFARQGGSPETPTTAFSGDNSVQTIKLPPRLDGAAAQVFEAAGEGLGSALVLDASACTFVDAAGFGVLWTLTRLRRETGIYILAPRRRFRFLGYLHRAGDFLSPFLCRTLGDLEMRLSERFPHAGCFVSIEGSTSETRISFLGSLTSSDLKALNRDDLIRALGTGHLTLDLAYCRRIDADGLGLLTRLKAFAEARGSRALVKNPSREIRASIEVAGLTNALL